MEKISPDFKDLNEETAKEIARIESFNRKDLNSIEEVLKSKQININVLKILSQSKSYHIRRAVMLAENTPQDILDLLLKDEKTIVRNAFEFRKLPTKWRYLKGSGGIINNLWDNPEEKVLEIFANWSDSKVRECVASDRNTPIKILNKLINDNDSDVSTSAKETIKDIEQESIKNKEKKITIKDLSKQQKYDFCYALAIAGFFEETSSAYSNAFGWLGIEAPDDFEYVDSKDSEIYQEVENTVTDLMHLRLYFCAVYQEDQFRELCDQSNPWAWGLKRLSQLSELTSESLDQLIEEIKDWG